MALLPDTDRATVRSLWARRLSDDREPMLLTKPQMLAAVNATDDWIDANAAAFNAALPLAARNNLTTQQKAELLAIVVLKRFGGRV